MDKFYCLVEGTMGCQVEHADKHFAEQEAERLARFNKGKKVFVLKAIKFCKVEETPVTWEDLYQ